MVDTEGIVDSQKMSNKRQINSGADFIERKNTLESVNSSQFLQNT